MLHYIFEFIRNENLNKLFDGFVRLSPGFPHKKWNASSTALVEYQKKQEVQSVIKHIEDYERNLLKAKDRF